MHVLRLLFVLATLATPALLLATPPPLHAHLAGHNAASLTGHLARPRSPGSSPVQVDNTGNPSPGAGRGLFVALLCLSLIPLLSLAVAFALKRRFDAISRGRD
ncbi:MAG: hypothetical protein HXY37_16335 [Chloroflexi bacterium]|nr:hypothetical protein [Chloroflexota bacterium]